MIGQVQTVGGQKQIVPLSDTTPVDVVQSGNVNSVTSNAVASALEGLIKYKDINVNTAVNTYTVSGSGLLYKTIINLTNEIGSGHTVLGIMQISWSDTTNYPFGFYISSDFTTIGLWTTSQNFKMSTRLRIVYL